MCECVYVDCVKCYCLVRSGGLSCLKPVAMVLCSDVFVEWLLLKPCCDVW